MPILCLLALLLGASSVAAQVIVHSTLEEAIAAAPNGGTIIIPSGFSEEFTTPIAIGNASKRVDVIAYAPVTLIAKVNMVGVDAVTLGNKSTLHCMSSGLVSSSSPAGNTGCLLTTYASTRVNDLLSTASGLQDVNISGWDFSNYGSDNMSGIVSGALLHIAGGGATNIGTVENVHILYPNGAIGLLVNAGVQLRNVEVSGDSNTGSRPCVVTPANGTQVFDIRAFALTCEHSGRGHYQLDINGAGLVSRNTSAGVNSFRCYGCRIEGTFAQGDSTSLVRIRDAWSVTFDTPYCSMPGSNTGLGFCFEISQSAAGRTDHVSIQNALYPVAANRLVANLITGVILKQKAGTYRYMRTRNANIVDAGR
jgi:hypothetical protein